MKYYLFLDDNRLPIYIQDNPNVPKHVPWTTVKSYMEFVEIIEDQGLPEFISYDHDLCYEAIREFLRIEGTNQPFNYKRPFMKKTGMDCLEYVLDICKKYNIQHPPYFVHSSNYICAKKMRERIDEHNSKII